MWLGRWVDSFTQPDALTPRKNPRYLLGRRLESRSGRSVVVKNHMPSRELNPSRPARFPSVYWVILGLVWLHSDSIKRNLESRKYSSCLWTGFKSSKKWIWKPTDTNVMWSVVGDSHTPYITSFIRLDTLPNMRTTSLVPDDTRFDAHFDLECSPRKKFMYSFLWCIWYKELTVCTRDPRCVCSD
jgi:hypothetical protein